MTLVDLDQPLESVSVIPGGVGGVRCPGAARFRGCGGRSAGGRGSDDHRVGVGLPLSGGFGGRGAGADSDVDGSGGGLGVDVAGVTGGAGGASSPPPPLPIPVTTQGSAPEPRSSSPWVLGAEYIARPQPTRTRAHPGGLRRSPFRPTRGVWGPTARGTRTGGAAGAKRAPYPAAWQPHHPVIRGVLQGHPRAAQLPRPGHQGRQLGGSRVVGQAQRRPDVGEAVAVGVRGVAGLELAREVRAQGVRRRHPGPFADEDDDHGGAKRMRDIVTEGHPGLFGEDDRRDPPGGRQPCRRRADHRRRVLWTARLTARPLPRRRRPRRRTSRGHREAGAPGRRRRASAPGRVAGGTSTGREPHSGPVPSAHPAAPTPPRPGRTASAPRPAPPHARPAVRGGGGWQGGPGSAQPIARLGVLPQPGPQRGIRGLGSRRPSINALTNTVS